MSRRLAEYLVAAGLALAAAPASAQQFLNVLTGGGAGGGSAGRGAASHG